MHRTHQISFHATSAFRTQQWEREERAGGDRARGPILFQSNVMWFLVHDGAVVIGITIAVKPKNEEYLLGFCVRHIATHSHSRHSMAWRRARVVCVCATSWVWRWKIFLGRFVPANSPENQRHPSLRWAHMCVCVRVCASKCLPSSESKWATVSLFFFLHSHFRQARKCNFTFQAEPHSFHFTFFVRSFALKCWTEIPRWHFPFIRSSSSSSSFLFSRQYWPSAVPHHVRELHHVRPRT